MSASAPSPSAPTLASRQLPDRVRSLLSGVLEFSSDELERALVAMLNEFEQQLFKFAEQARSNQVQTRWLETQRLVKRTRPDLVPRFLIALEAELACVRDPPAPRASSLARTHGLTELSLVNELEMDEVTVMGEISNRAELRCSLPLYLLGQRFGVLAGKPAMDAESLPVGPQALCRMIRVATDCLELTDEHRLIFLRIFDRQVMPIYGNLVDAINTYLAKNGVLPHLQYVPVRARPPSAPGAKADEPARPKSEGDAPAGEAAAGGRQRGPAQGGGDGSGAGEQEVGGDDGFQLVRQLLAGRRQLLGKLGSESKRAGLEPAATVDHAALQSALSQLQPKITPSVLVQGKPVPRNIGHLKQDLLALLRQSSPDQEAPALTDEDNDTIDLISMLYDNLMKDVRSNSPAASLLSKLQVPLLRVALQDKGFFTRQQHPARQLLNTIAETGVHWMGEDDADASLVEKMNSVVDRTVREFDGNVDLFGNLLGDLSSHLQTVARKAEVAERRHVEAARGKEKLALARERAASVVEGLLKQQNLPRFTHTLLSQAWTDVMALTALRHGEDSPTWKQQLGLAERLIQIARAPANDPSRSPEEDANLRQELEQALSQVGYQGDEVDAIARRLVQPQAIDEGDSASRTELAMRLKARARLGEELNHRSESKTPLSAAEQARLDQLKQVPFGSWFEFVLNQRGDRVRRRLSWFSTVTGQALFVNQRGQKVGEHTLESLARMMVQEQLFLVTEDKGSLIDRAWSGVVNALRSFAGQKPEAARR